MGTGLKQIQKAHVAHRGWQEVAHHLIAAVAIEQVEGRPLLGLGVASVLLPRSSIHGLHEARTGEPAATRQCHGMDKKINEIFRLSNLTE